MTILETIMINIAVCKQCGEILQSKHRHDYVVCACPNQSMADGGLDYKRRGGVDMSLVIDCDSIKEAKALSKRYTK